MPDNIVITIECKPLTISTDAVLLGAQYDNESRQLVFERPDDFSGDDLVLYFSNGVVQYDPVNIGSENVYTVTSELTRRTELRLQIAFFREDTELEHSNILRFELSRSLSNILPDAVSIPERLRELQESAFTGVDYRGQRLSFTNLAGEELGFVTVAGGDGSSSGGAGYSPYIGANGNWYEWSDSASGYVDTGVQARGETGKAGQDGAPGAKGAQGLQGIQGATGATGAAGYTPVRGTDYWTAADISAMNTANQAYIDQKLGVIENGYY